MMQLQQVEAQCCRSNEKARVVCFYIDSAGRAAHAFPQLQSHIPKRTHRPGSYKPGHSLPLTRCGHNRAQNNT